jgi:Spy/CpxP family protein refolding chaperone
MRHVLTFVTMTALLCGLVSLGLAEDNTASKSPDNKKVEAKADTTANADVRAKIHRTMAALIEAQSAEEPDQAKIDKLTKKLQQLRGKLQVQSSAVVANPSAGWACPWGGPGMGFGRGAAWGGPGRGMGGGRGAGFGPGAGRGPGAGPGMGRGPGGGRGYGPGGGLGLGAGGGAFVDEDNDGICDYYELQHGMHK